MVRHTTGHTVRFLVFFVLILCIQAVNIFPMQAQPSEAYALVEEVNTYRASVGLPRLETSPALMIAAQRHADWMIATSTHSHTGEGGSSPQSRATAAGFDGTVGENVGSSTTATPAEMIFFWDQSYAHRINMRAALATHIGAGYAASNQERLYVLLIGTATGQKPQAAPPPIAGGTPAIGYTPPPNMGWTTNGQMHQGSYYAPVPVDGQPSTERPETVRPAAVAYVMPFDMIRRAEPDASGSVVHVVESGQTAWAIAARYGADLNDILALNHLGERSVLKPGDRLIIRLGEGQLPPTAPAAPSTHTVLANDSLWTIAARYNRSVDELRAWNNLTAQDVIQPGMVLHIAPTITVPAATALPTLAASAIITPSPISIMVEIQSSPTAISTGTATALPPATETPAAVAQVPTLVEITEGSTSPEQETGLRLLLILSILGAIIVAVWVVVMAYLIRKSRRSRPG